MLDTQGAVFEFKTISDDQFLHDYHRLIDVDIPLMMIESELLFMMELRKVPQFTMPGSITIDGKAHTFYFEVVTHENSRTKEYRYLRYE
ncbi:hypothetical protein NRIC_27450 [Enterococcus florum]|uniref:Uncharacterized protein n=1 Tax=Enterococcus florum TaxID=2480627 RepID=A0A4P5PE35_9ENTE|nr:DUF5960 family protein [Enterococcus florum]GCF94854.1 hypothetical protein NRIC_27450 [Enterococcus florum]